MNKETEFKKWVADNAQFSGSISREIAQTAWNAAWEAHAAATANSRAVEREVAEQEVAEQAARQIEQANFKRKFLALASTAFLAGLDTEANIYRNLASHL